MTDPYCRSCYRTLPPGRDLCAMCEQKIADAPRTRVAWVLIGVAAPLLILGMLGHNNRLCLIAAGVAVVGILVLSIRTVRA